MRKSKNIVISLFSLSALLITGCTKNETENVQPDETIQVEEKTREETSVEEQIADEISSETVIPDSLGLGEYSEDRAWVSFQTEGDEEFKYGCIDKNGKMIFYISGADTADSTTVSYSNGYSYFKNGDTLYLLDLNGNLVNEYQSSDNISIKAYADGYVWTEEYTSGFDSAFYTYILFDPEGTILAKFEHSGTEPIAELYYYSCGVWGYDTQNLDGESIQRFYCSDADKWVESTIAANNHEIYFYEDSAVIGIEYEDPDETGYRARLCLLDTSGSLREVPISDDLGWNWDNPNFVNEGYCVLEEYESYLISYNLSTGEFSKMENEYSERVKGSALPEIRMFDNGRIAMTLTGNDEENYVALFDDSWNMIGEPLKYVKYNFSDGMLIVLDWILDDSGNGYQEYLSVYNSDGEKIFSPTENGYVSITPFEDGVARALPSDADPTFRSATSTVSGALADNKTGSVSGEFVYINSDGNRLFENIDMITAIEINLE